MNVKFWLIILVAAVQLACAGECIENGLPMPKTTYNRAQTLEWISDTHLVVGRWDGTVTTFREPLNDSEYGRVLVQATMTPSAKGIEMMSLVSNQLVITSNGRSSIAIWAISQNLLNLYVIVEYPEALGVANSATTLPGMHKLVAIGHETGHVSVWTIDGKRVNYLHAVDVRTPSTPSNPWKPYNVRGLVPFSDRAVITDSEDGNITILDLLDKKVLVRKRYNPDAKRGINNMSKEGDYLLVANCSVGPDDSNLWLYKVSSSSVDFLASANLLLDQSREQGLKYRGQTEPPPV